MLFLNPDSIGEDRDDSYWMAQPTSGDWIVYFSERGNRLDKKFFVNESDACGELASRLLA